MNAQQLRDRLWITPAETAFGRNRKVRDEALRRRQPGAGAVDAVGMVHEAEA